MPFGDPIGEDDIRLGVIRAQRQDLLIRRRFIPRTRSRAIWKFEDDQMSRPLPLQHV